MEDSQAARAKESHRTLPLQPLLSTSPWSIVLPFLQVVFLQTVITFQSDFPKDTTEECQGQVWARHSVDATKCFYAMCHQLCMFYHTMRVWGLLDAKQEIYTSVNNWYKRWHNWQCRAWIIATARGVEDTVKIHLWQIVTFPINSWYTGGLFHSIS